MATPRKTTPAGTVDFTKGLYRRIHAAALRGRRINSVSVFAEVLFWRLQCCADDFGTFHAPAHLVLIDAFPLRREIAEEEVVEGLRELAQAKLIRLFEADGEWYGSILDFERFQPAGKNGRRVQRHPLPPFRPSNSGESGGIQGGPDTSECPESPNGESGGIRVNPENPIQSSLPHKHQHQQEQEQEHQHQQSHAADDDADAVEFLVRGWKEGGCGVDAGHEHLADGFTAEDLRMIRAKVAGEGGIRNPPGRIVTILTDGTAREILAQLRARKDRASAPSAPASAPDFEQHRRRLMSRLITPENDGSETYAEAAPNAGSEE